MSAIPGVWHARRLGRAVGGVLRRRARRGVVLLYHRTAGPRRDPQGLDVSAANFDAQLAVLTRRAVPLALEEFEARRRAGTLPARAVAVTFDDGYADNLHAAAPLLARHRVSATVFVTAGMVGSRREFWWDDAERIAVALAALEEGEEEHAELWLRRYRALCAALRPMGAAERETRLAEWRGWAGIGEAARPTHRTLATDELLSLARQPGIAIGAHTVTHPVLAMLPPAEQRRELRESREWLARTIGMPVRAAAYPFGTRAEVSGATERAAAEAGFDCALATEPGSAWRWSPRWRLPRALVRDWDAETFSRRLDAWLAD